MAPRFIYGEYTEEKRKVVQRRARTESTYELVAYVGIKMLFQSTFTIVLKTYVLQLYLRRYFYLSIGRGTLSYEYNMYTHYTLYKVNVLES